jgi:hypothetical protein
VRLDRHIATMQGWAYRAAGQDSAAGIEQGRGGESSAHPRAAEPSVAESAPRKRGCHSALATKHVVDIRGDRCRTGRRTPSKSRIQRLLLLTLTVIDYYSRRTDDQRPSGNNHRRPQR